MLVDEPRVVTAWYRGWESVHFQRLVRWRDEGFAARTVYDIGAHQGTWAEMCQAIFSPRDIVLFEPQREFLEQARAKPACRRHGWRLLPVALGDNEGEEVLKVAQTRAAASLLEPLSGGGLSAQTRCDHEDRVRVLPLDSAVSREHLPPPDLVKMDVQGFECHVIAGGANTLRQAERMVIEASLRPVYRGQPLLMDVLRRVADIGFEVDDVTDAVRTWPSGCLWQVDLWLKRST